MNNPAIVKKIEIGIITISLFSLILGLLLQFAPSVVLPNHDSGVFLNAGSQILKGKLPYVDFWDHKGPMIFYLNAIGLWITHGSQWGVWILEFGFLAFSALFCFLSVSQIANKKAAFLSNLFWLAGLSLLIAGNLTEEYNLLFQFFTIWLFWQWLKTGRKPYLVLIGMVTILGFLLRPNLIGEGLAIIIIITSLAFNERKIKKGIIDLLSFGLGASVILGIVVFYFWITNVLSEAVFTVIFYNFLYSSSTIAQKVDAFIYGLKIIRWLFPVLLLSTIYVFFEIKKKLLSRNTKILLTTVLLAGLIDMLFSSVSGRSYDHYYITWLPLISIFGGYATIRFFEGFMRLVKVSQRRIQTLIISVIVVFGCVLISNKFLENKSIIEKTISNYQDLDLRVTKYIRQNSQPDDYVLAWGYENFINFRSRRNSPSRFAHQFPIYGKSEIAEKWSKEFYIDLSTKKPVFVITAPVEPERSMTAIPPLDKETQSIWLGKNTNNLSTGIENSIKFINNNYEFAVELDGWRVYKLKK